MFQLMMFGMNLALTANNSGLMWVAVELATLTTVMMVGIYRSHAALEAAWDLVKGWEVGDHERLRRDVTRLGLKADVAGRSIQDVAKDALAIASGGLKARERLNGAMLDERVYLAELQEIADRAVIVARGRTKFHETRDSRSGSLAILGNAAALRNVLRNSWKRHETSRDS